MCGETSRRGTSQRGLREPSGSSWNTSSAAPAIHRRAQGLGQVLLDGERAAPHVDEVRGGLEEPEEAGVEHAARRVRQRGRADHPVRSRRQPVQVLHAVDRAPRRPTDECHLDAEGVQQPHDLPADGARPDHHGAGAA